MVGRYRLRVVVMLHRYKCFYAHFCYMTRYNQEFEVCLSRGSRSLVLELPRLALHAWEVKGFPESGRLPLYTYDVQVRCFKSTGYDAAMLLDNDA